MEIIIILALILLNGVFAMAELALVSAKRARLEKASSEGSEGARTALQLADDPSAFLSTVQVGITLISIFNGAFGEASLVARLTPQLSSVPAIAPYARQLALAIVVIGITFASIVLGELVPKRIAIRYPEFMATSIARPLQALATVMAPFVTILSGTTDLIMRLLRMHQPIDTAPTPEDISGMLKEGSDAGVLEQTEVDIATRALRLDDQRLNTIMTPRIELEFIDLNDELGHNLARIARSPYSRFPVYKGDRADVLGIVHAGDLFEQAIRKQSLSAIDIAASIKPALHVPESVSAMGLLESLQKDHAELAFVVDEHGQLKGMVTLLDLMAALVGAVPGSEAEPDAMRRDDGSWLMDGALPLARVRGLLGAELAFPREASGAYHTLAGFVLDQLGRLPKPSDHVSFGGYRFEVMDMDRHRIDRVLVSKA